MKTALLDRITTNLNQCGGKPCIRGMRIRVTDVLELLVAGLQPEQIIAEELPSLELADIQACLQYVLLKVDHPALQTLQTRNLVEIKS